MGFVFFSLDTFGPTANQKFIESHFKLIYVLDVAAREDQKLVITNLSKSQYYLQELHVLGEQQAFGDITFQFIFTFAFHSLVDV